jgi:hypothetical protein
LLRQVDPNRVVPGRDAFTLRMPTLKSPSFTEPYDQFLPRRLILPPLLLAKEGTLSIWATRKEPPRGFQPLPEETEVIILQVVDREIHKANPSPPPPPPVPPAPPNPAPPAPPAPGIVRHAYVQFQPGAQGFFHVHPDGWGPKRSDFQEVSLTGTVQLNAVLHDDDNGGLEAALALQGEWDLILHDPVLGSYATIWGPQSARQVQVFVQLNYVLSNDFLNKLNLQPQLSAQIAGARGWNFDPSQHRWTGPADQAGLAAGGGITWNIDKDSSLGLSVMSGPTYIAGGTVLLDTVAQLTYSVNAFDFINGR